MMYVHQNLNVKYNEIKENCFFNLYERTKGKYAILPWGWASVLFRFFALEGRFEPLMEWLSVSREATT